MNFLESFIAQAESDVAAAIAAEQKILPEVTSGIAAAKTIIGNPEIQNLISIFSSFLTHTTAPGVAVVVGTKPVVAKK